MKRPKLTATWIVALLSISLLAAAKADEDALMQALREEMARTMEQLRMENLEAPYFVAYTVRDAERMGIQASFGALLPSSENRSRNLTVEVRVGDASFDNTNFTFGPSMGFAALPLGDNVAELRRQIWLATDNAYKTALQSLAAKRAALQNETRSEAIGDLSPAEPFTYSEEPTRNLPTLVEMQSLVRRISELFTSMPDIMESSAGAAVRRGRTYYFNSEGSSYVRNDPGASLNVFAQTQAPDGTVLHDFVTAYGNHWDEIADEDALTKRVSAMAQALAARRSAAAVDNYIGPVLFEGQAAAELFAQVFMPRLLGLRLPDANPRFGASLSRLGNPFLDKLGARVMARSLSLKDDPTLRDGGFFGGYPVDDEGVPAQATSLIENGILKTLLTTRNPVRGIEGSTGNRRGMTPAPSNLLLTARRGMSSEELLDELMLLVEERQVEYGIVVRRLGNRGFRPQSDFGGGFFGGFGMGGPQQPSTEGALLAYKVFPDGSEELIRNAEFSAIADSVFKEIVAASESSTVYTFNSSSFSPFGGAVFLGGAGISGPFVSLSVPDLLFEELSLRKPQGNLPRLPVAAHPFFGE